MVRVKAQGGRCSNYETLVHKIMKVLITGGNGFVGSALLQHLSQSSLEVSSICRRDIDDPQSIEQHIVEDLTVLDDWSALLQSVDAVVHCAGVAHAAASEAEFNAINVELTLRLAKACVEAGVKRFVFLSSLKALGETTSTAQPFNSETSAKPQDAYGRSKLQAEQKLYQLAECNCLELVIIRPPLVYGPGVKANFQRLLQLSNWPLPFAAIKNRRDMVSVYNLCDLIVRCIDHPAAKNQTFLVSDGKAYSLANLLRAMSAAQGKRSWLWPVPAPWLRACLKLLGRADFAQRLLGDLEVDISHTVKTLDWKPQYTLEDTLRKMRI